MSREDGADSPVDRNFLVITRWFSRAVVQRLEHRFDGHCAAQRGACSLTVPKFIGGGVAVYLLLDASQEVEFDDFASVGCVGKLEAQNFSVVFGLL